MPLPTPIALTLADYEQTRPSFRKLHRLVDVYEVLLKYTAIIAVQNFYAAGLAATFPDRDRDIRDCLSRPMLGHWQGFLRNVLKCFAQREDAIFSRELFLFHFRSFSDEPKQQKHITDQGAAGQLLTLRNELAHGATLPDEEVIVSMAF
jgi:hypothetical protein